MNGGDSNNISKSSPERIYDALVDRCKKLEASHAGLKKQFKSLLKETSSSNGQINNDNDRRRRRSSTVKMTSDPGGGEKKKIAYVSGGAYKNVLHCVGHAVFVTRPVSGEFIYWNNAAEKLFGYKESELNGRKFTILHVDEEYLLIAKKIMERLRYGECWSGQFPFKKKTGEIFMALVTQSPMYEDGELVGIITVASDAAVFNSQNVHQPPPIEPIEELHGDEELHDGGGGGGQDDRHSLLRGLNLKSINWNSRPQITSSVSDLASKVLRKRGDSKCNEVHNDKEDNGMENLEIKSERPPRIPARKQIFQFAKSFTENRRDGILKREEAAKGLFHPS